MKDFAFKSRIAIQKTERARETLMTSFAGSSIQKTERVVANSNTSTYTI